MRHSLFKKRCSHIITNLYCIILLICCRLTWCKTLHISASVLNAFGNDNLPRICNGKLFMIIWLFFSNNWTSIFSIENEVIRSTKFIKNTYNLKISGGMQIVLCFVRRSSLACSGSFSFFILVDAVALPSSANSELPALLLIAFVIISSHLPGCATSLVLSFRKHFLFPNYFYFTLLFYYPDSLRRVFPTSSAAY